MVDTGRRGSAMGGGYAVGGHVQRPPTDNGITVGGPKNTSGGLCAGNRL